MHGLYEQLEIYLRGGRYPFHMPGHKGNAEFLPPRPLIELDVTELGETDNLHDARGCIAETQGRIAEIYGADESFLLVNGSTAGIVAAIGAVCGEGDIIAVARNCHRSVFSGMALSGAVPFYFMPGDAVQAVGDTDRLPKAVIVTSPTYEGNVLDIAAIAEAAHRRGIVLIVDEAHGAHFPFHEIFPKGALELGADIVVHSFHKTLPAFSQSAALHLRGGRVDARRVQQMLMFVQTSSPSYLIMAATDYMLKMLRKDGKWFERYAERLIKLRNALGEQVAESDDIGKLVLPMTNGEEWAKESKMAFEMITKNYVLAMTSVADRQDGFDLLLRSMDGVKGRLCAGGTRLAGAHQAIYPLPEIVLSPRATIGLAVRRVLLSDSVGEVAGGFLMRFPPGVPIVAPGERITGEMIRMSEMDCEIDVLLI